MNRDYEILEKIGYVYGALEAVAMLDSNARGVMECCLETIDEIKRVIKENSDGCTHP